MNCSSTKKCCACLSSVEDTLQLGSFDFKNELLMSKLQNVVPEVEWCVEYNICKKCNAKLDIAFEFRALCIRLDFERKSALANAITIEETFPCHCGVLFNDKQDLEEHNKDHHIKEPDLIDVKKFECGTCNKSYSSQKILNAHLKKCNTIEESQGKKNPFSCEKCDLSFATARLLVKHCTTEHSMNRKVVKPYTCDECPIRFASSTNLIQHKKYHEGSRSHVCSFCGKSYITKSDLTVHESSHLNRRNYKCKFCPKAFNANKNLYTHVLVVHTESSLWKFACDVCNRRFPLKSGFDQHMKRHTGDKLFVCHICNKSFVSKGELQRHINYHSSVRNYKCDHCDKAYKNKWIYQIHLNKAHGIGNAKIPVRVKKFACHICSHMFFDKNKMERHLCTHSGVKPYTCQECSKKFSDKYYLKLHRKKVHNAEDDDLDFN